MSIVTGNNLADVAPSRVVGKMWWVLVCQRMKGLEAMDCARLKSDRHPDGHLFHATTDTVHMYLRARSNAEAKRLAVAKVRSLIDDGKLVLRRAVFVVERKA